MKPELWTEVKTLFLDLVDTGPEHRARVLESTAEPVRSEVRRLLANSDAAESAANPIDAPLVSIGNLDELFAGVRVFEPGQLLLDRFEIRAFLGAGGMGEVFAAYDRVLGEPVALKAIRPVLAGDPAIVQRFRWEVQRARSVSHPNVCRVYELFTAPGAPELVFLTMELIAGPTLAARLAEGPVSFAEMNRVAEQVCAGLHAAHAAGLIHRDLKTGNILIDCSGNVGTRAVITDFGLARRTVAVAGAEPGMDLSLSGPVGGTPVYQAPELANGDVATPRSDIYALGVVLFRMAAGRYPDGATSLRELNPELPDYWAAAVGRCLEADPMRRPESAATLAAMLKPGWFSRRTLLLTVAGLGTAGAVAWLLRPDVPLEAGQPLAIQPFRGTPGKLMENLLRLTLAGSRRVRVQPGAPAAVSGEVSRSPAAIDFTLFLTRPGARPAKASGHAASPRELPAAVRQAAIALELADHRDPAAAGNIPLDEIDTTNLDAMEALTSALTEMADGKLELALTLMRSATERDPEFALAYVYIALLHATMRRDYLGLEPSRKALALKHRLSRRVRPHAEAVHAVMRGDFTSALASYEEVARLYPHEVPLQRHVAQMYTILLRRQEALQVVRRAVVIDDNPLNQMMLASALADLGEHAEAGRVAAECRKQQPESVMGWIAKGYSDLSAGRLDDAIGAYEKVAVRRDLEAYSRSFQIRALLLAGRLGEAERRLQLAIGVVAADKDQAHEDLFRYWLGQLQLLTGNPARAVAEAHILAARPAQPPSLFALRAAAEIAAAAQDVATGRRTAAAARGIANEYPSRRAEGIAAQCEGLALLGRGEPAAAMARLEEAEALWGDVANWWSLAEAARVLGRWRAAASHYARVSEQFAACLRFECILNWITAPAFAGYCLLKAGDSAAAKLQIDGFLARWKNLSQVVLIRQLLAL